MTEPTREPELPDEDYMHRCNSCGHEWRSKNRNASEIEKCPKCKNQCDARYDRDFRTINWRR